MYAADARSIASTERKKMSLLIKGIKKPARCIDCVFMVSRSDDDCILQSDEANAKAKSWDDMMSGCPLVEVPPHGRLIDKDKLRRDLFVNFNGDRIPFYDCDNFPTTLTYRDLHSILSEQPTIIEAEGSKQ